MDPIHEHKIHRRRMQIPHQLASFKLDPSLSTLQPVNSSPTCGWKRIRNPSLSPKGKKNSTIESEFDVIFEAAAVVVEARQQTPIETEDEELKLKITTDQRKTQKFITSKLSDIKRRTNSNILVLDNVLKNVSSNDTRCSGIGSSGGHIAREQKAPGPHNGHFPPKREHLFLATAVAKNVKIPLLSKGQLIQPEWDRRFIEGKVLSNYSDDASSCTESNIRRPSTTGRLSRVSNFRQEIVKFREQNKRNSRSPSFGDPLIPRATTAPSRLATSLDLNLNLVPYDIGASRYSNSSSSRRQSLVSLFLREKIPLDVIAHKLWNTLIGELKSSGKDVTSADLYEVHQYLSPPQYAISILGFICTLMGVEPTWAQAKNILLSDCKLLCVYLAEVIEILNLHKSIINQQMIIIIQIEPLKISSLKLKNTIEYKIANFPTNPKYIGSVSKPIAKLAR